MRLTRADFPPGFVFGAATSAYQIEGHAAGGAGRTHWDDFAETPGNVRRAETGAVACDHLHRWAEDLDLAAAAGLDAYRFSTSWARVLPEGRGPANPAGLDFYDRLVDGLCARGLKPALTLHHWELPSALADLGGWRNPDIAAWFADFAAVVLRRIGDRVWSVAPINEPWCVAWLSHFLGRHAPGLRDIRAAARAMHHVLLAHGRAVAAARALGVGNIGAVCNFEAVLPADGSPAAAAAAARHDALLNRWFLEAMTGARYPEEALAGLAPHLPAGWEEDLDTIAAPLDWIGVNYYTCKRVAPAPGPWPALAEVAGPLPKTGIGWEIFPEGLSQVLRRVAAAAPGLPIMVTENGMAGDHRLGEEPATGGGEGAGEGPGEDAGGERRGDPGTGTGAAPRGGATTGPGEGSAAGAVEDTARIAFLAAHLAELRRALAAGVPVTGCFVWSLLDNYEWALGYAARFGLVHVDFATQRRTPKASFRALGAALARGPAGPA